MLIGVKITNDVYLSPHGCGLWLYPWRCGCPNSKRQDLQAIQTKERQESWPSTSVYLLLCWWSYWLPIFRKLHFEKVSFYPDGALGHKFGSCFKVEKHQLKLVDDSGGECTMSRGEIKVAIGDTKYQGISRMCTEKFNSISFPMALRPRKLATKLIHQWVIVSLAIAISPLASHHKLATVSPFASYGDGSSTYWAIS